MCTLSVSNVIYHKFSHGDAFYMLNGKNVNVMLELCIWVRAEGKNTDKSVFYRALCHLQFALPYKKQLCQSPRFFVFDFCIIDTLIYADRWL